MKFLFLLICFVAASQAIIDEWTQFKKNFNKVYTDASEEISRVKTYLMNKRNIEQHNIRYSRGEVMYRLKMNIFGDLAANEYRFMLNGFKGQKNSGSSFQQTPNQTLPSSLDWRLKGAVTDVKQQGQCGSCWAFSATGALESHNFLKTGKLVSLSEQNLVDCSSKYGNNGCNGGSMQYAFMYVRNNGGIETESSYPYTGKVKRCKYNASNVGGTCSGHVNIPTGNEAALKAAVATVGPVSAAITASEPSFQFYSDGVYDEPNCSSVKVDHGVLVVGYGISNGTENWIVKNSWGSSWGLNGYILMRRNKNNQCGIATSASYPTV